MIEPASETFPTSSVPPEADERLVGLTGLRARKAFDSQEPQELGQAVEELIHKNLDERRDWSDLTRRVMRGVVENLSDREDSDWAIRCAAQRAVLAVARRWGNIVLAGKASVLGTREAASNSGLDTVRAAQQAGLGAIEGVLQVGPVAYGVLQREISPIVEDFEDVLAEERRSGEWMLRSVERTLIEKPLMPPPPPPSDSVDLSVDDYLQAAPVAVRPLEPVAAPEEKVDAPAVHEPQESLPPETAPAIPSQPARTPGLLARVVRWFIGLFGKR